MTEDQSLSSSYYLNDGRSCWLWWSTRWLGSLVVRPVGVGGSAWAWVFGAGDWWPGGKSALWCSSLYRCPLRSSLWHFYRTLAGTVSGRSSHFAALNLSLLCSFLVAWLACWSLAKRHTLWAWPARVIWYSSRFWCSWSYSHHRVSDESIPLPRLSSMASQHHYSSHQA